MKITNVKIREVTNDSSRLRAYVSATFDDVFVVHNIKIIDGTRGMFIAMPSRKTKFNEYKDIAHPIASSFRKEIESAIINAYHNHISGIGAM